MSAVVAAVAGTVVAAGASIYAANKQASAAEQAANTTVGENAREFNLARGDTAPQRALGADATATLARLYGYGPNRIDPNTGSFIGSPSGKPDMSSFFTSPDYSFNLQQGQQAVDRSAAARGGLLSGAAVKAGTRYASGLASGEYNNYVNRLMAQAGLGQSANSQSIAAGDTAVTNDTAAINNAANARASAYGTIASGVNNSVQGGMSNYLLSRYLGGPGAYSIDPGYGSGAMANGAVAGANLYG